VARDAGGGPELESAALTVAVLALILRDERVEGQNKQRGAVRRM
jgi:hypothetical protein